MYTGLEPKFSFHKQKTPALTGRRSLIFAGFPLFPYSMGIGGGEGIPHLQEWFLEEQEQLLTGVGKQESPVFLWLELHVQFLASLKKISQWYVCITINI